jgi:hypothetical protein
MEQLRAQAENSGAGSDRVDATILDSAFNQFRRSFDPNPPSFESKERRSFRVLPFTTSCCVTGNARAMTRRATWWLKR